MRRTAARRALGAALSLALLALAAAAFVLHNRAWLLYSLDDMEGSSETDVPMILPEQPTLARGAEWFDDWYALERLDAGTIAIDEPRYWQQNTNYLLLGEQRAVLFDTGPGVRDIRPVVEALTDLPVVVIASHYHFDHVGGHDRFPTVALADLPLLRRLVTEEGLFTPTAELHLGEYEERAPPTHRVAEWWRPGRFVELGGRRLLVLHTPGHSRDSISLYDPDRRQLFCGDYLYVDYLYAFLPGSSLGDYLQTAHQLLSILSSDTTLFPAHSVPVAGDHGVIALGMRDVMDLRDTLERVRSGAIEAEGRFPRRYRVNERIWLFADFEWFQDWN